MTGMWTAVGAIGSAAVGGMMSGGGSGGGGGGSQTTTIQKADPWEGVQGPLRELYAAAGQYFNSPQGTQYYPGSTIANQSNATQAGNFLGLQRAMAGSPLNQMAQDEYIRTMRGDYMNPASNPWLSDMVKASTSNLANQYTNTVAPTIAGQFSAAGRYGSGAQMNALAQGANPLAQALENSTTNLYGNAYNQERTRQNQMSQMSDQFANLDYSDIQKMMAIGASQDQYQQSKVDAAKARWDFNQNVPFQKLSQYNSILSGAAPYASQSQVKTAPQNTMAGIIGGGMMGSTIGKAFGQYMNGSGDTSSPTVNVNTGTAAPFPASAPIYNQLGNGFYGMGNVNFGP